MLANFEEEFEEKDEYKGVGNEWDQRCLDFLKGK